MTISLITIDYYYLLLFHHKNYLLILFVVSPPQELYRILLTNRPYFLLYSPMVDRPLIQYDGFRRHRAYIELNAKVPTVFLSRLQLGLVSYKNHITRPQITITYTRPSTIFLVPDDHTGRVQPTSEYKTTSPSPCTLRNASPCPSPAVPEDQNTEGGE